MDRYLLDQDAADSTPVSNTSTPISPRPYNLCREPIQHSEQKSETSSNSEGSFGTRNMYRGNQRGGRGGYRGGRGGSRTYSDSSGSSNGQHNPNRPTLKATASEQAIQAPRARMKTPEQLINSPACINSPVTPVKQLSSFDLNGHGINETYIAQTHTGSTPPTMRPPTTSPPRQVTRASPQYRGNRIRYNVADQRSSQRPISKDGTRHWAHHQEGKIKLFGIPKSCWTKDTYHAMSPFGTVFRIDMIAGTRDNTAYVVFRPPPFKDISNRTVRLGAAHLGSEILSPQVKTLPSPANPAKLYCEFNILPVKKVDFGVRVAEKTMIAMHTLRSPNGIYMMLNLDRKELDIQFPIKIDNEERKFRFRLPIALISRIYRVTDNTTEQPTLIIPFDTPPQFFMQRKEGEYLDDGTKHTSFSKDKFWNDWKTWFRATDVINNTIKKAFQGSPLMNHKDTAIIDIGQWTSYRMTFDAAVMTGLKYKDFSDALADHGVVIENLDQYTVKEKIASPLWSLLQEEISGTHPHLESTPDSKGSVFDDLFTGHVHLSFPVRYQLEACLSNGYLKEHNMTSDFLEKLAALEPRRTVYILEKVLDKQHTYYDPMDIFSIRVKQLERKIPSYCVLQRSVIITPTMMHVASPIMETSNRIIRKHAADSDRFIRVKFSDEKAEGQLRSMPNGRAEATFDRVLRAMKHGIVVAGRYYEFLAFGNSQFREHGAYFYAPTLSKSADDIRVALGDFSHIKTVAKFGARLGQCFSTTRAMRHNVKVIAIPDIVRNDYTFTDGVGKISFFLAQMAAQELGLAHAFDDPPSLFQFRLGGCKGVLALDPRITGAEVHIRPSQLKFVAPHNGLEIIRSSSLATPFFNRQIIVVLSYLGVPDSVVIRKQQEMINDYENAMIDEGVALQKLQKHIDMNQTTLTMAGMLLDGFMRAEDPFVMSLLKLWRACTIKNLKEKARIAVDDGAFVLGCIDETATLRGHLNNSQSRLDATRNEKMATLPEIFLQVDNTSKRGHYKIIEGVCVLARNPSLHPGDVRIVRAVDVPMLHHLKNVVVLPQIGDRDMANMCSGGDLDGDDYMVLWDADLIPDMINVPPMDFTAEKPMETEDPITASHIGEFFVMYMKNDSLGQIAHAHLAQADFQADGVKDEKCLKLAELHSKAVDFPKSGLPAEMSNELRPWKWPHFMEKKYLSEDRIYHSKKILGMLYDQVQLVDFKPQWENPFDKRILETFEVEDDIMSKATELKASYDECLRRLMAKHGIKTEFEAWSVFVLVHNHESGDYKFAEEFGRKIGALKSQCREECRVAAGRGVEGTADLSRLEKFVAAMYTVTARQMEAALVECRTKTKIVGGQRVPVRPMEPEHMPLISFPWLFPSELGKMATGGTKRQVDSLSIRQGTPKQQKKQAGSAMTAGTEAGVVETETGVTRYGELLDLDFSLSNV
ncbi:RNA-dependent RNA polymerase [Alternaria panax]|uniref:RNA-dependent RNA polymerase n=1 Tax=Alternaria panax TaxID=48097 RepID=A0AAD4FDA1_9PLEO|nr:RNA-dependent RNA polymerase [Alternaria panax]